MSGRAISSSAKLSVIRMGSDRAFELNQQALHEGLTSSIEERRRAEESGDRGWLILTNVDQFALLFNFDLSCLLQDMRARTNTWHTNLHARTLVLTMFECVDDFKALLGREFRSLVQSLDKDGTILAEANKLHSELRGFLDQHPRFKEVRDTVTAHREHDAGVQIHLIENLDVSEVESAGYEMMRWLTRLHQLTAKMTEALRRQSG
jgi:hypothetical protein